MSGEIGTTDCCDRTEILARQVEALTARLTKAEGAVEATLRGRS